MAEHPPIPPGETLRHFTVAVFVVHDARVLLHFHRKLGKWLPPGGHIEANELPDAAAAREVLEETGICACLVGAHGLPVEEPRQLVVPAGVQVEAIYPGHEHIDLVYFARPDPDDLHAAEIDPRLAESDRVGWYAADELAALGANAEIQALGAARVRRAALIAAAPRPLRAVRGTNPLTVTEVDGLLTCVNLSQRLYYKSTQPHLCHTA
ncbi:MAG: NUDIX domain-containing protein [Chloroflexi bacterium]|nr:NUDIX domain-containing protein [Chloroflexota bacterium]